MAGTQRAARSIVHDQIRLSFLLFYSEVQHMDNVGMLKLDQRERLLTKALYISSAQARMQHFDGGLGFKMDVLRQIDPGKAASAQQARQAIVAQLLSHTI